jgi:hypothetical protein
VRDGWIVSADSLSVRAFRGLGVVCGPGPTPRDLHVLIRGVRAPDPTKDSILVLDTDGRWTALALDDVAAAPSCDPRGVAPSQLWHLSGPAGGNAILARWFERGSYHVSARAVRYRRGAGGRQPLTPEVVRTPASGFSRSASGVALLLLVGDSPEPWRVLLAPAGTPPHG